MSWVDFVIRVILALILGAAIGLERQWRKTMGVLKTNVLVSLGSAMFVMMSTMFPGDASPTRVAAQVVSGVGFLGGGVILREGASVRGLNTAATLWCAAAVGTFVGAGLLFQAYFGTLAVVGANLLLRPLVQMFQEIDEQLIAPTKTATRYRCRILCAIEDEANIRALLLHPVKDRELMLTAMSSKNTGSKDINNSSQVEIQANYLSEGRNDVLLEQVVSLIKLRAKVSAVSWEFVEEDTE